jgi:hypothetical protein
MKKSKVAKAVCCVLMMALIAGAVLVVVAGCDPTGTSQTVEQGSQVEQQAINAARQANLAIINSAIAAYEAEHDGEPPTDISQLTSYFGGKIPTDPGGGTFYLTTEGGQTKAAIK